MLLHNLKKAASLNIYSCNYAKGSRGSTAARSQKGSSACEMVDAQSCEPITRPVLPEKHE